MVTEDTARPTAAIAEEPIDPGPAVSLDPRYVVLYHDSDVVDLGGYVDLTETEG